MNPPSLQASAVAVWALEVFRDCLFATSCKNLQSEIKTYPLITAITLALGTIEGVAYWWMHPASTSKGEPVLVYRPQVGLDRRADPPGAAGSELQVTATADGQPTPPASPLVRLPEVYAKSAPMLRCTSGQVLHARLDDTAGIHLAFFEWDGTDTGSVLEAFRHMPEACMGSIGMKLVSKEKPISYQVDSETLVFDHTIFREGGGVSALGPPIHAFRAVWVAGLTAADSRQGLGGNEFDRLRTIRLKSALHRFNPAHARVIQGAVRGIPDPALAWQAFEQTMLQDLDFEKR